MINWETFWLFVFYLGIAIIVLSLSPLAIIGLICVLVGEFLWGIEKIKNRKVI